MPQDGYALKYFCQTSNRNSQDVVVNIYQKTSYAQSGSGIDITPVAIKLTGFYCEYINGNEEKYLPTIIGLKAVINIRADINSPINSESFYTDVFDEWLVEALVDNVFVFKGFITTDNEPYIMKMKPYDVVITASDGLGLLKNISLSNVNGNNFTGRNSLLSYIAGALNKTGLKCGTRIYCNIFNISHNDRYSPGSPDMFSQTKLHYKSLMKNVTEFVDCYSALEFILSGWCSLYQYQGEWVINSISERVNGDNRSYYSIYDTNWQQIDTINDSESFCLIGKYQKIQAINLDQNISYMYPVKSVKTTFEYNVPENLINNQKLQYFGNFISPLSGPTHSAYEKFGWEAYSSTPAFQVPYTGSKKSYIKREFDPYGTEIDRYYVIEHDSSLPYWIRNTNDDFFVQKGDRIYVSITFRLIDYQSNPDLKSGFSFVYILKDGAVGNQRTDYYTLSPKARWINNDLNIWTDMFLSEMTLTSDPNDNNMTEWVTLTMESDPIPVDGKLFMGLQTGYLTNPNNVVHIKDTNIEYKTYLIGSKFGAKGEYWLTEQNRNVKDTIADTITISDSKKRIVKGALWNNDGVTVTVPRWHLLGDVNYKTFSEMVNLGRYRHQYRRQKKVQGTFKGVFSQQYLQIIPGMSAQYPLGFHRYFKIEFDDTTYVLSAPLSINYLSCQWKGTLIECGGTSQDANSTGDTHIFNYIF